MVEGGESSSAESSGLLVLSDLHLGGPLRPPLDFAARRKVATVDRELARFLAHHAAHPPAEGRWTLVLNGDTFDFMHMDLRPPPGAAELSAEEYECGLAYTSRGARYKLALMASWHRRAFQALARFAAAGHRVVFVAGNHDADLTFPAVRTALVGHLVAALEPAGAPEGDPSAAAAVRRNVRVSRWFHLEPGRAYIEHGHRFDPYTTFHEPLLPRVRGQAHRLAESFCHVSSRLFVNRIRTLPIHDLDAWRLMDFVRWGLGRAGTPVFRLLSHYLSLVARLAHRAVLEERTRRREWQQRQRARLLRLRAFARSSRLSIEAVSALDALGVPPISSTIRGVFHALYFHHVGVGLLGLAAAAVLFLALPSPLWRYLGPALLLLGAAALFPVLQRLRPDPDSHPRLAHVARRVAEFARVPVVIFGHTHQTADAPAGAEESPRSLRPRWLNPGAWENAWRRPRRHARGADCTCGLRFARITGPADRPAELDARLVPWCRVTRAPLEAAFAGSASTRPEPLG